jgi:uncharacterized protein YecT (DUF1311 family)
MSIGEVSFFTGIVLFFIGIIGGGIDIKEVKIPQIAGASRFACFMGSVIFIVLGLYLKNAIPPAVVSSAIDTIATNTPKIDTPDTQADNTTQPAVTNSQTQTDNVELAKYKAKEQFEEANKRINIVWNATTKEVRDALSPEQLQWLRQRESDCAHQAASEEANDKVIQETIKYNCMVAMTDPRIEVLKEKIAAAVAEQSAVYDEPQAITNNNAPTNTSSIDNKTAPDKQQVPTEDAELAQAKAKDELDEANKRINIVWNDTTKEIRDALLPEQRQWLKQREDDCALKAANKEANDMMLQQAIKFRCMAAMTDPRTEELKQKIAAMTQ